MKAKKFAPYRQLKPNLIFQDSRMGSIISLMKNKYKNWAMMKYGRLLMDATH